MPLLKGLKADPLTTELHVAPGSPNFADLLGPNTAMPLARIETSLANMVKPRLY